MVLACRSEERAKAAIVDIIANTPSFPGAALTADRLEILILDLADLDQVRLRGVPRSSGTAPLLDPTVPPP